MHITKGQTGYVLPTFKKKFPGHQFSFKVCAYPGLQQTLLCWGLGPNPAPKDAPRASSSDVGTETSLVISLLRVTWQRRWCAQR